MPERPLMSAQYVADWLVLDSPPIPLWHLPADVADEVREMASVVNAKKA